MRMHQACNVNLPVHLKSYHALVDACCLNKHSNHFKMEGLTTFVLSFSTLWTPAEHAFPACTRLVAGLVA